MKRIVILLNILCFLGVSCKVNNSSDANTNQSSGNSANQSATFQNPVLSGDYADPSVIRVGSDYYATATSSEWAPLFPLLHSKNLVDWETVGHVFPNSLPAWADAHFWAPEITYEKGKYYIYYTAKKKGGNLCVGVASATKPTGPYTDHGPLVCQEVGSIDGFPIRDEKGDLYLVWKEDANSVRKPTPIWGQRMNEERTALTGEKFELFRNDANTWEGGLVEGPAFVKKDDYYYIFYAGDKCCGRGCTYGVGVARSKSVRGPWEKYAQNPIMKQNETWKCAGHGSVVTDEKGRDFFMYHAYATDGFVYPGRQGLLDEITWTADGWPKFNANAPSVTAAAPHRQDAPNILNLEDEFTSATLANSWQWSVTQSPKFSLKSGNQGQLSIPASPENIGTFIGQRSKSGKYTATASLDLATLGSGVTAGLAAIGDPENAVGVAVQGNEIILWSMQRKQVKNIATAPLPQAKQIQFKLVSDQDKMLCAFSTDGTNWTNLNNNQPVNIAFLPPWDRGVRLGLTAKGPATATASYNWFKLNHN